VTAPSISEILYISKEHGNGQLAQAYALFNMAFSSGFLFGPLWGGFVTEKVGWNTMVTSLGGLALVTLAPVLVWTGGPMDWKSCHTHIQRMDLLGLRKGTDYLCVSEKRNVFYTPLTGRRPKRVFDKESHCERAHG
jgi:MFS family permease